MRFWDPRCRVGREQGESITVRFRIAGAVVAAVLTATSLTACRTNVGFAATIDGKRYTESDVTDYLTPKAQPVSEQSSDGAKTDVPTRSFVVETLIIDKLFHKVLAGLPGGAPDASALNSIRQQGLQGSTVAKVTRSAGIRGFTPAFEDLWVRTRVAQQYLTTAQQQGVDVRPILQKLKFRVSVNPRYGTWDASTFSLNSGAGAGTPAFLNLRKPHSPAPAAATGGN
jgi:hypothetical protein